MRYFLGIILVGCVSCCLGQDHVRFVVTGDDRWDTGAPRAGLDENGVNVTGLKRLMAAVMAEKPDALLMSGDLVGGAKTDEEEASQFDTWIKTMQPVYDAGIRVLTVRGNHEIHCPGADAVWRKVMSGSHADPGGGPKGEEGLTYAFTIRNCCFIALDEYEGQRPTINQTWLDGVLKAAHPPHIFAFAHQMAFYSGHHVDTMGKVPTARDAFMKSLKDAGARVMFFGHDHLYDHTAVSLAGWRESEAIHQFVVGTAGAPFVKGETLTENDGDWKLKRIAHVEQRLGYCLVDVDGPKVTIVFKAEKEPGIFEAADTYTYTLPTHP